MSISSIGNATSDRIWGYFVDPPTRNWSCEILDEKWGPKEYVVDGEDFCEDYWDTWHPFDTESQPDCDHYIAPNISFYNAASGNDTICTVDMNDGRSFENLLCIYEVFILGTNNEGELLLLESAITFYFRFF